MDVSKSIISLSSGQPQFLSKYLDWRERPESIVNQINCVFEKLKTELKSSWGVYNGENCYEMLRLYEHTLIKQIIQQAPKDQKEFYFLDIGSGNFQWVHGLASFLNAEKDLPTDIQYHLIGVRGEGGKSSIEQEGKCKTYRLTAFKIEELFTELENNNLFIEKKIDFAISRWCFRHLVDPVGTFIQTYNLLRPCTGTLMGDGFFFLNKDEPLSFEPRECNGAMVDLLVKTRAPFLMQRFNDCRSLNRYILRKPNDIPCQLPMQYLGLIDLGNLRAQVGSNCITQFNISGERYNLKHFEDYKGGVSGDTLYGDKQLYESLRKGGLIGYGVKWGMTKADLASIGDRFKVHQAVLEGDLTALNEALATGYDIDESDLKGNTPLHLSIINNRFEIFEFLLGKGANKTIPSIRFKRNGWSFYKSLLEEAMERRYDDRYVARLR